MLPSEELDQGLSYTARGSNTSDHVLNMLDFSQCSEYRSEYQQLYSQHDKKRTTTISWNLILNIAIALLFFVLGAAFSRDITDEISPDELINQQSHRLPPQAFFPPIPTKEVQFTFPTNYSDTTILGDNLWNELMPLGAGFLRVPYPRMYEMPPSKTIPGDHQLAEIYSVSMTHQLHCLAVLRHVITKYEAHDKSRFAGDGHEYHCIDYLRQAILCAGDTTLDHAQLVYDEQGSDRKSGFNGDGAVHVCRDWDVIRDFLVERREGNRTGIF